MSTLAARARIARAPARAPRRARRAPARAMRARAALGESLSAHLASASARGDIDADLAIALNSVAIACKRVRALVARAPIAGNTGAAGGANARGGASVSRLAV